ncbi:MAG: PSD1 and planctomycete cytochrome C domain-containing protein [Opitutales bacterium]
MKRFRTLRSLLTLPVLGVLLPASAFGYDTEVNPADLPPPATGLVDFSRDIKPILEQSCLECHGAHRARPRGRFLLDSREHALTSGAEGNNILPGNSARSPLIHYVARLVPDLEMPPIDDGEPLSARQVSLLRAWIDDGAPWPREVVLEAPEEKQEEAASPASSVASRAGIPPPAGKEIHFIADIKPILEASCIECHGDGRTRGDFSINTRENLLRGSDYGPVVVPGKSEESYLIELVAAIDPDNFMPNEGPLLSAEEVGLLRAWIDQDLPWEEGFTFRTHRETVRLAPRRPDLPASDAQAVLNNPIDLLLEPYFEKNGITPPPVIGDAAFARRVYLDTSGLLPSPEELRAFVEDERADKRERLVQQLLSDNQSYAEHWLTFWNDALRNDYRGTGYIDGGRKQITSWLYSALAHNMPYDQFVRELVSPSPESEGFTRGIVWRGSINASEVPPMQAAQNVSQVFMGVNLKCASCHDSFIDDWTLSDAYGLANIYSEEPMEMFRCDQPTGQSAGMKFLYEELGTVDPEADRSRRLEQLAEIITSEENGRLNRTIVNRLWSKFLGRGLVEPIDDMDAPPWNADILDWLAVDLADNRYDLKKTIKRILTSHAYQLPAIDSGEWEEEFVFRGPLVRRLSAEQFRDALTSMTGAGYSNPAANIDFASILSSNGSESPRSGEVRASLANADPLLTALGRPPREQVVTRRYSTATTLEALELTNGHTLAEVLQRGAGNLVASFDGSTGELVEHIFIHATGREPTKIERELSVEFVGDPFTQEGIEDFLWTVIHLPEFQLIY